MSWPLMGETITFSDRMSMAYFALTADKFTSSKKVVKFEHEWNKWLGSKHSLFVSSGSTANFLLVAAVKELYKLKTGDKVLVPACTWVTNVAPIIQLGLTPIFVDINLQDFSFDIKKVKRVVSKHNIKMVFTTHLLGFPYDTTKLKSILPNAIFIDDVCESHGCTINDRKVGSNSLGATYSFYFGHHMSTIEGGMISTNNVQLYDLMLMKRSHGMARESLYFKNLSSKHKDIDKQFLFITDGYNFRNHEIPAVLGIRQLKRLDNRIVKRRQNHKMFCNIINNHQDLFYPVINNQGNSSFCLPFICKTTYTFNKLKKLFEEYNIEYRPIVSGNLLKQPFLKGYKIYGSTKNNVDILHKNGLYIGNNHLIGSKEFVKLLLILKELKNEKN